MKRKLAIIAGIGILMISLFVINCFAGNPVSHALARKAAQQYINENYSSLDLQIQNSNYSFKFGSYFVYVASSESADTAFSIYVDSFGNVLRDDYEFEVANHFTTFRRLDAQLREYAREKIGGKLAYDFDHISLRFLDGADLTKLTLDMELDVRSPPLPLMIDAVFFHQDVSYGKIAEAAKDLEKILAAEKIPVQQYSVRILPLSEKPQEKGQGVSWVGSLSVSYFPAEQMDADNLPDMMEAYETERIRQMDDTDKA